MRFLRKIIHDWKTPPAVPSMSVVPVRIQGKRRQTPDEARHTFARGLQRQQEWQQRHGR